MSSFELMNFPYIQIFRQNKQLANALRIVHDGALELFNVGEHGSAGDLCILYCSGLDEMECGEMYEKMAPTLHQQCQRLHMKTLQKLDIDQPERDQFEKVGTCQTQNLEIYCSPFSKISRFLERFPLEHIDSKNSSDFRAQIYLTGVLG